jgi:nucleotide-binding universal stress UspA family protein
MEQIRARRRIVVGVDGSLPSLFALRWAGRESQLRDAELCAVIVDPDPVLPQAPYAPTRPPEFRAERWAAMGRVLVDAVATALGPVPDVSVHEHVEEGEPAEVLARYCREAELLVLGSRLRDESSAASLGPTVRACIRVVTCPVVVVNHDDDLLWRKADKPSAQPVSQPEPVLAGLSPTGSPR